MQSKYQVKGLLEGLLWLKQTALYQPSELSRYSGICYHLNEYCSEDRCSVEYDFVAKASSCWVGHSGERYYPVIETERWTCWQGENLKQRLSLLDHLISVVEGMTNEECIRKYSLYK